MRKFGIGTLIVLGILLLGVLGFGMKSCSIFQNHAYKSMENAVISYDEYQNIYNTCKQLNDNLGVIQTTPENDPQFAQFSRTQRINAIKMDLNRWIAEYNAKSKHIDKKWWKSSDLPYELTTNHFSNYSN